MKKQAWKRDRIVAAAAAAAAAALRLARSRFHPSMHAPSTIAL